MLALRGMNYEEATLAQWVGAHLEVKQMRNLAALARAMGALSSVLVK